MPENVKYQTARIEKIQLKLAPKHLTPSTMIEPPRLYGVAAEKVHRTALGRSQPEIMLDYDDNP